MIHIKKKTQDTLFLDLLEGSEFKYVTRNSTGNIVLHKEKPIWKVVDYESEGSAKIERLFLGINLPMVKYKDIYSLDDLSKQFYHKLTEAEMNIINSLTLSCYLKLEHGLYDGNNTLVIMKNPKYDFDTNEWYDDDESYIDLKEIHSCCFTFLDYYDKPLKVGVLKEYAKRQKLQEEINTLNEIYHSIEKRGLKNKYLVRNFRDTFWVFDNCPFLNSEKKYGIGVNSVFEDKNNFFKFKGSKENKYPFFVGDYLEELKSEIESKERELEKIPRWWIC